MTRARQDPGEGFCRYGRSASKRVRASRSQASAISLCPRSVGWTQLLGTKLSAIDQAEDRDLFKQLMEELGQPIPESEIVNTVDEALEYYEIGRASCRERV